MDKYTVDIDKVLNDFEYSELTDQHSNVSSSQNSNINLPRNQQSDPYKLRSTPVKHSINNVFQSLNEYLNTDISDKSKSNQPKSDDKNTSLYNIHTFCETSSESLIDVSATTANIKELSDCKILSNSFLSNTVSDQNLLLEKDSVTNINNKLVVDEVCPVEGSLPSTINENESKTNLDTVETKRLQELSISNLESGDAKMLEKSSVLNVDSGDTKIGENLGLEDTIVNIQLPKDVIKEVSVKESVAIIVPEEPVSTLEESSESDLKQQPVVGFSDIILNDSEAYEYLNELELEDDVGTTELKKENQEVFMILEHDSSIKLSETDKEVDIDAQESENNCILRPNTLNISNSTQIDLIGEPGSTPYNNVYLSKRSPVDEAVSDSETDSSSPTFSDTDTAASTVSTESGSVENKAAESQIIPNTENDAISNVTLTDDNAINDEVNLENASNTVVTRKDNFNITNDGGDNASYNPATSDAPATIAENSELGVEEDTNTDETNQPQIAIEQNTGPSNWLGKHAPLWIPDSEALNCLHCDSKFTVIKRRHHCRACGLVLCSKCCNMRYKLEYLNAEARVCLKCYDILNIDTNSSSGSEISGNSNNSPNRLLNQPNPNNPMEYCSVVPPLQQINSSNSNPPTVMVPVGVLKRKGSSKSQTTKSVMFCDGIRPGSELTNLDNDFNYNESGNKKSSPSISSVKVHKNAPALDPTTKSFIPCIEDGLPPTVTILKSDISYTECINNANVTEMLRNETLTFALQSNLHVHVKIINMDCCINKWAWCFSTEGMISVGQDELVYLIELMDGENLVPKDVFFHLSSIYNDAIKGSSITEYGISLHSNNNFLDSKNHIGFLYIRSTFQCLQNLIIPKEPYLIGILIHRWEMPWAKIFPLRLILRLGAEYRYYPCPIISTRHRESVFVEIGHTIINLLADFRNFSYTLPNIRGLNIHMEDKNTTVTIPSNRYEQVMKSINNSSEHILAFGGNFSTNADSHLVCIQDTHGNNENTYKTHAINIQNRPRKITGASFIVFNGALKSSSGLTAKSSIVEDGLMIQIPPESMLQIRESLRNMKNYTIQCGCINATSDETVSIIWGDNDVNFNKGIQSAIDKQCLSGVPSIRVHNGKDYVCSSGNRKIRWTEVFILQSGDESSKNQDFDFSKLAENISKATCQALVKYLDLLSTNNFYKIGIRTTLHAENVSYCAGSNGMKLPPIYMKSLDNELIPVLHRITSHNLCENAIVLELVFRILNT